MTSETTAKPSDPQHAQVSRRPFSIVQGVVSALLFVSLAFIVVSNYAGWTARVEVTRVKRDCADAHCQQQVFVEGREQAFRVSGDRRVEVGDRAEIHGRCNPRCKLELVSFSKASKID